MDLITVADAGTLLDRSPRDVYTLIGDGSLRGYRRAGRILVDRAELEPLLDLVALPPSVGIRAWSRAAERVEALERALRAARQLQAHAIATMRGDGLTWRDIEVVTGLTESELRARVGAGPDLSDPATGEGAD